MQPKHLALHIPLWLVQPHQLLVPLMIDLLIYETQSFSYEGIKQTGLVLDYELPRCHVVGDFQFLTAICLA